MKKIALMTWFQYNNYGTVLQAVSLSHVFKKFGYHVDVINYISKGYDRLTKIEKFLNPMLLKDKIIRDFENIKYKGIEDYIRNQVFDMFRSQHLNMTRPLQTLSELNLLNKEYDAFVCGSDQIWSPREFNPRYFLDFVAVNGKKIAYAPSFGRNSINNTYIRKRIAENIDKFKHLSIREKQGASIIKEISNKTTQVLVDPTLLLSSNEWDEYLIDVKTPENYILCYFLGNNSKYWKHIEAISKNCGLQVLVIPIKPKDYHRKYTILKGIGPGEFLSLVKKASLVCTDSFHGVIFSVIYNRPFLMYKRFSDNNVESQNSRIYNLLSLIGKEDRLVKNSKIDIDNILSCDYSKTYELLDKEKKKSINFLKNALQDAFSYSYDEHNYEITNTCCGCSVCINICKYEAIDFKINSKGFYEAKINPIKCSKCDLCRKVCPFNGNKGDQIDRQKNALYMLRSKSKKVLATSTSGGAAYEIAAFLSKKNYDVIGCVYDKETACAYHKRVNSGDIDLLTSFQGSKYIQSNTLNAFKNILNSKKAVVFGTPCQIAGLDNFLKLKHRRNDFVLVDLICHGVPSIHLWHKYLKEGSQKFRYGDKPDVYFRYKKKGWKKIYIGIFGNGKRYIRRNLNDMFYRYFEMQNCYMDSCYECNYRTHCKADIRIGDYWGEKYSRYKKSGASMVISMTSFGDSLLKELYEQNKIELIKEDVSDYWNIQYPENPIKPVYHEELILELKDSELTLKELKNKYFRIEDINRYLATIYGNIKHVLKCKK